MISLNEHFQANTGQLHYNAPDEGLEPTPQAEFSYPSAQRARPDRAT